MLTEEQIETLNEIQRDPRNLNIDSKVPSIVIRYLINNGYITKSKQFRSTDGNIIFHYLLTEKGQEVV